MGRFAKKIKLPTITADLTQWLLNNNEKTVIAVDSRDQKPVIIRNFAYLSFYEKLPGNDGAYYLLRTNTGEYFKMKLSDEKKP